MRASGGSTKDCPTCKTKSSINCTVCNGTKVAPQGKPTTSDGIGCLNCLAHGVVVCTQCHGQGQVPA